MMNDAAGILLRCVTRSLGGPARFSPRPTQQSAGSGPHIIGSNLEPKMNRLRLSSLVITGADTHILHTSVAFLLIHSSSKQSTHLISSVKAIMGLGTDATSWPDPPVLQAISLTLLHRNKIARKIKKKEKRSKTVDKSKYQPVLRVGIHFIFIPRSLFGITSYKQSHCCLLNNA